MKYIRRSDREKSQCPTGAKPRRVLLTCFFLSAAVLTAAGIFLAGRGVLPVMGGNVKNQISGNAVRDSVRGTARIDEKEKEQVVYSLTAPWLPASDDDRLYLFTAECFSEEESLSGEPAAVWKKERKSQVTFPYREEKEE